MQNDLVSVAIRGETAFLSGQGQEMRGMPGALMSRQIHMHVSSSLFSPLNTVTITFLPGTP